MEKLVKRCMLQRKSEWIQSKDRVNIRKPAEYGIFRFSFPKTPAPTLPTAASNIKKNQKKNLKKRYLTSNIMQMMQQVMHKNKNVMKKCYSPK